MLSNLLIYIEGLLYANFEDKFRYLAEVTVGLVFLGTPFRGTKWQPFADSVAQLMQPAGSHRGIIRELNYDDPGLLDILQSFCRLLNKLSTTVSCFSELYETDYGKRFGIRGVARGMVRAKRRRWESVLMFLVRRRGVRMHLRPRQKCATDGSLQD